MQRHTLLAISAPVEPEPMTSTPVKQTQKPSTSIPAIEPEPMTSAAVKQKEKPSSSIPAKPSATATSARERQHHKLVEYQEEQSKKRVLKPSGYAYRSIKNYDQATCFMCRRTFYSNQGFTDHVESCVPKDGLYSIIPTELVFGLDEDQSKL